MTPYPVMRERMTSQTRWALSLVQCEGVTYGLPLAGWITPALHSWARSSGAEHLGVVVPAGTMVVSHEDEHDVLIECEFEGTRVVIPRDALEEVH